MSIESIEQLVKQHAADRALLAERVQSLDDELQTIKRRRIPGIKSAVSAAKDSHVRLHAAIDAERDLFKKPRTRVLHGIKVGLQKAKGKLLFDTDKLIVLVRKHFKDQFDVLVKTKLTPVKKALGNLSVGDLKKLGCTIEDTGDEVVIAPTDTDIDKLVDALLDLKASDDEEQEDAA